VTCLEQQPDILVGFRMGLAEATFFFIVPDVCLTFAALRNPRVGLKRLPPL